MGVPNSRFHGKCAVYVKFSRLNRTASRSAHKRPGRDNFHLKTSWHKHYQLTIIVENPHNFWSITEEVADSYTCNIIILIMQIR